MTSALFESESPEKTPLHFVADALLEAHTWVETDGDARLLRLVEAALLHVGRRLAAEMVQAVSEAPVK